MSKYTKKFKYKKDKEAEQTIQISKPLHRPGNNLTKPLFVTQLRPIIWTAVYSKEKKINLWICMIGLNI